MNEQIKHMSARKQNNPTWVCNNLKYKISSFCFNSSNISIVCNNFSVSLFRILSFDDKNKIKINHKCVLLIFKWRIYLFCFFDTIKLRSGLLMMMIFLYQLNFNLVCLCIFFFYIKLYSNCEIICRIMINVSYESNFKLFDIILRQLRAVNFSLLTNNYLLLIYFNFKCNFSLIIIYNN